ncbi:MAG: hypothetical protein J6Y19_05930 [Kiritimatiellae bacterium]|nr:hypothetical protein [Kiritimatiellia bacterium]
MKNGLKLVVWAGVVTGLTSVGFAQSDVSKFVVRSSYPVAAAEPICMFTNSSVRLPGRGGAGADSSAARVEIRAVKWNYGSGTVVPPTAEGVSDESANPLVAVTRIGAGTVGVRPGRFAVCIPREALTNTVTVNATGQMDTNLPPHPDRYVSFFARVYDAPTVEESHYYVDSLPVRYNPDLYFTNMVFAKAMKAIGGGTDLDSDDDGLSDQEESAAGTDYLNPDTDGDGLLDGVEVAYGLDPNSPLLITALTTKRPEDPALNAILDESESEWHVEWPSSTDPEVKYELELVYDVDDFAHISDGTEDDPYVLDRMVVDTTITQTNWVHDITEWIKSYDLPRGFVRLKVILPELDDTQPEAGENGE